MFISMTVAISRFVTNQIPVKSGSKYLLSSQICYIVNGHRAAADMIEEEDRGIITGAKISRSVTQWVRKVQIWAKFTQPTTHPRKKYI
jgi:hypothetical protein